MKNGIPASQTFRFVTHVFLFKIVRHLTPVYSITCGSLEKIFYSFNKVDKKGKLEDLHAKIVNVTYLRAKALTGIF
jgi:hypothetical protein